LATINTFEAPRVATASGDQFSSAPGVQFRHPFATSLHPAAPLVGASPRHPFHKTRSSWTPLRHIQNGFAAMHFGSRTG